MREQIRYFKPNMPWLDVPRLQDILDTTDEDHNLPRPDSYSSPKLDDVLKSIYRAITAYHIVNKESVPLLPYRVERLSALIEQLKKALESSLLADDTDDSLSHIARNLSDILTAARNKRDYLKQLIELYRHKPMTTLQRYFSGIIEFDQQTGDLVSQVYRPLDIEYGAERLDPMHRPVRSVGRMMQLYYSWLEKEVEAAEKQGENVLAEVPDFWMWLESQSNEVWLENGGALADSMISYRPYKYDSDPSRSSSDSDDDSTSSGRSSDSEDVLEKNRSSLTACEGELVLHGEADPFDSLSFGEAEAFNGIPNHDPELAFVLASLEPDNPERQPKLFVLRHEVSKKHHSTMHGGEPVIGAGMIEVKDGKVVKINNKSGHYKTRLRHILRVVKVLNQWGVLADNCEIVCSQEVKRHTANHAVSAQDPSKSDPFSKGKPILDDQGKTTKINIEARGYTKFKRLAEAQLAKWKHTPAELAEIKQKTQEAQQNMAQKSSERAKHLVGCRARDGKVYKAFAAKIVAVVSNTEQNADGIRQAVEGLLTEYRNQFSTFKLSYDIRKLGATKASKYSSFSLTLLARQVNKQLVAAGINDVKVNITTAHHYDDLLPIVCNITEQHVIAAQEDARISVDNLLRDVKLITHWVKAVDAATALDGLPRLDALTLLVNGLSDTDFHGATMTNIDFQLQVLNQLVEVECQFGEPTSLDERKEQLSVLYGTLGQRLEAKRLLIERAIVHTEEDAENDNAPLLKAQKDTHAGKAKSGFMRRCAAYVTSNLIRITANAATGALLFVLLAFVFGVFPGSLGLPALILIGVGIVLGFTVLTLIIEQTVFGFLLPGSTKMLGISKSFHNSCNTPQRDYHGIMALLVSAADVTIGFNNYQAEVQSCDGGLDYVGAIFRGFYLNAMDFGAGAVPGDTAEYFDSSSHSSS